MVTELALTALIKILLASGVLCGFYRSVLTPLRFLCIGHLFSMYGIQLMLHFRSHYIRQHIRPAIRWTRIRKVSRL